MKIVVVGASPMGCLFAGLLGRAGEECLLLDREEGTVKAVNENGLKFEGTGGMQRIPMVAAQGLPHKMTADMVLLFVRTAETQASLDLFAESVGTRTAVVSMQDGVGGLPHIIGRFGIERVFACSTNLHAHILEPGHVLHTGWGDTKISSATPERLGRAESLAARFTKNGVKATALCNIAGLVWTRTIIQCGFYALTAITQMKNGRVLEIPESAALMENAVREADGIVRASGVTLLADNLIEETRRVIELTAQNDSPMLQALFRGKPSEAEGINGAVVELAEQQGADAPVNRTLLRLVKIIESTRKEN